MSRMTLSSRPQFVASTAPAVASFVSAGVRFIIWVALRTMGSTSMNTSPSVTAPQILFVANRLKMVWIHARRVVAQMIEFQSVGHWPNEFDVREYMGKDVVGSLAAFQSPMSPFLMSAQPAPAIGAIPQGACFIDSRPKTSAALFWCQLFHGA